MPYRFLVAALLFAKLRKHFVKTPESLKLFVALGFQKFKGRGVNLELRLVVLDYEDHLGEYSVCLHNKVLGLGPKVLVSLIDASD